MPVSSFTPALVESLTGIPRSSLRDWRHRDILTFGVWPTEDGQWKRPDVTPAGQGQRWHYLPSQVLQLAIASILTEDGLKLEHAFELAFFCQRMVRGWVVNEGGASPWHDPRYVACWITSDGISKGRFRSLERLQRFLDQPRARKSNALTLWIDCRQLAKRLSPGTQRLCRWTTEEEWL